MEAKWLVLVLVFAAVLATYVYSMRVHANAGWSETLWPWTQHAKASGSTAFSRTYKNSSLNAVVGFCHEIGGVMLAGRKFWLVPVLVLMTIFGGLIVLTKGSIVAPFLYTWF